MPYILAVGYAILNFITPWEKVQIEKFTDLNIYIAGFESGSYDYLNFLDGMQFWFSEPLWRIIVNYLNLHILNVSYVFKIITFFCAIIYSFYIFKTNKYTYFFLISPLVIDLLNSQVRSALMGSIFLLALLVKSNKVRRLLFAPAFLIHGGAILIFGFYGLSKILFNMIKKNKRYIIPLIFILSILIPLVFIKIYSDLLLVLNDRRFDYEKSYPGGIFQLCIGITFVISLLNLRSVTNCELGIFSFIITGFFLILSFYEFNALRLISITLPVIAKSSLLLPRRSQTLALSSLYFMTFYHSLFWFQIIRIQ